MRLHEYAARGNATDQARRLQGSRGDSSLTAGNRYGFTGIPLAVEHALHPLLAGHQSRFLGRKVNSCLAAQAKLGCVVGDAVDAEAHAEVVEENIAGLIDSPVNVDG